MSWNSSARPVRFTRAPCRHPLLESLENRLAPATVTYDGSLLQVTGLTDAANSMTVSTPADNLVQIVINNTDTFTSVPASADFTLSNADRTLQINTAPGHSPVTTFQLSLGTAADSLTFGLGGGSITSTGVSNVSISTGAGNDLATLSTIDVNGSLAVTGGAISIQSTTTITTHGNAISLTGQGNSSQFSGVNVNGATLDAGGGTIALTGTGGGGTASLIGVMIWNGARVQTTGTGSVILNGTSGVGSGTGNYGIYVSTAATQVTAGAGGVSLTGRGQGTATSSHGVALTGGTVSATLSGAVTIQGTGSASGTGFTYGVLVNGGSVNTQDGTLTITGTGGGTGSAVTNRGISLTNGGTVRATGTGAVCLTGTGGNTTGANNQGVYLTGATTQVTAGSGGVSLTGFARGSGSTELGFNLLSGTVSATLSGAVTIQGTGSPNGAGASYGGYLNAATVSTQDGNVTITGTGGGAGSAGGEMGLSIKGTTAIRATGMGSVALNGISGNTTGNTNYGIYMTGTPQVTAGSGGVSLMGTARGTGINELGINISGGTVSATLSGAVTIQGHGGANGSQLAYGAFISGTNSVVSSVDGDVTIIGIGGGSGSAQGNVGVSLANTARVRATGLGAVRINGTGGTTSGNDNVGVFIHNNASVTAATGGVSIIGTSNGSGAYEWGVQISTGTVSATGNGAVSIRGTGSASGIDGAGEAFDGNHGVFLGHYGSAAITTQDGDITITGTGGGVSTASNNVGIDLMEGTALTTTGTGAILLNGTGGNGADHNYGVSVGGSTQIQSASGSSTVTGTGRGSGTANYGISVGSALQGGSGTLTLMTAGAIAGTGTITAATLILDAGTGIGTAAAYLQTTANVLSATTDTGGVFVHNSTAVALDNLSTVPVAPSGTIAVDVTGAASLDPASSTLTLSAGASLALGEFYTLIHTTAGVTGQFQGLPEGSVLTLSGERYQISYQANAGNDVILTRIGATATHLVMDPPAQAIPGGMVTLTVRAVDASGNLDPMADCSVLLKLQAGPSGGKLAGTTMASLVNGVATFSNLSFNVAGNYTLVAANDDIMPAVSSVVTVAPATHFSVTGMPKTLTAGQPVTLTLTALDARNRPDRTYRGTALLTSSDPQANFLGGNLVTFGTDGTATVTVNLATVGKRTVTATDVTKPAARGTSAAVTINPAAAARLSLTGLPPTILSGTAYRFTVTALDTYGNKATGYRGTVAFTSSDTEPEVVLPAPYPFKATDKGAHTFSATLESTGNPLLTVADTDPGSTVTAAQPPLEVVELTADGITGPTLAVRGQPLTFALSASETGLPPSTVFTYRIDWDGNGKVDQTVSGVSGMTVDHVYPAVGNFTARVTIVDAMGNVSPDPATQAVSIKTVALEPDPTDNTKFALYIGGSPGNDTIVISPTTVDGKTVAVRINRAIQPGGPFTPTGEHIFVHGQTGTDVIQVASAPVNGLATNVAIPALLFAGSGKTTLSVAGSSASNVLVGGAGKDTLIGGNGRDVLIGGNGASVLRAGSAGSLLIGGSTLYDTNVPALLAIMAEWGRTDRSYAERLLDLHSGGVGSLNGGYLLTSQTVLNSTKADQFTAGADMDWFWIKATDLLQGTIQNGEVMTFE